jgi:hypothetical protein
MSRAMIRRIEAYTGIDAWRYILSPKAQARGIARILLKGEWKDADPAQADLIIELPCGSFKIVDTQGNVESCEKKVY